MIVCGKCQIKLFFFQPTQETIILNQTCKILKKNKGAYVDKSQLAYLNIFGNVGTSFDRIGPRPGVLIQFFMFVDSRQK